MVITQLIVISQFLTDLQNSFTPRNTTEFIIKPTQYFPYFSMLLHYHAKFRIWANLQKNNLKIMSHLTKTEMSRHMAEYCHKSCSKCQPFTRIHAQRCPCHSSIALSMMSWSMPCQTCSKCCFSSSMCAPATGKLAAGQCPISCRPSWQG